MNSLWILISLIVFLWSFLHSNQHEHRFLNLWGNGFKIKIFRLLVFTKFSRRVTVSSSLTRLTTSLLLIVSDSSAIFDPINYTPLKHSWCFVCKQPRFHNEYIHIELLLTKKSYYTTDFHLIELLTNCFF